MKALRHAKLLDETSIKPRRSGRIGKANAREAARAGISVKTILVPTDFSPASRKAIAYASKLADLLGSQIVLVHVVEPIPHADFEHFPLVMTPGEISTALKAKLDLLCKQEAVSPKVIGRNLVRHGVAFREIVDGARAINADLIVIATHGLTGATRVIFGSTTEKVVRHAPCPVLVVRPNEHEFITP